MDDFTPYRRTQVAELRHWKEGDDMTRVSVSAPDRAAGSPKPGDMIARNPKNHDDQWLVAAAYFADNFEPLSRETAAASTEAQIARWLRGAGGIKYGIAEANWIAAAIERGEHR